MDDSCEVHFLSEHLPEPLPTLKAIEEAKETFEPTVTSSKVTRIGEHYVVKRGRFDVMEGWTMLYLRKAATDIAVPDVYAIFTERATKRNFIVMEYIQGTDLRAIWGGLEVSKKEDITAQLAAYFANMRALPSPGFFGRALPLEFDKLDKQPLPDFLFNTIEGVEFGGPFATVRQLGQGLVETMKANRASDPERANFYGRVVPKILAEGTPVFTHGDLQLRNIVLRHDGKVFIVDWGLSGWFPSCWEYCYAIYASSFQDDWHAWIPKFLPESFPECLLLLILRDIYWGAL
ncbi:kinase-like domain-containing protein [Diplogelasinospora grovesii]|uniref:Kinase-like domain-containing protein n=1 Tax=Diplogelasinospora grovesii TaxID=303347 RepID=A0AAN6S4K6_9PEZI|nr:kinase-like domain-containing protein [Diplogelasinospora grovesii]